MNYAPIPEAAGCAVLLDRMIADRCPVVLDADDHEFTLRDSKVLPKSLGIESVVVALGGCQAQRMTGWNCAVEVDVPESRRRHSGGDRNV